MIKLFDRIVKAAEGAALGTGTTMDYEMIGGTHDLLYVPTLQKRVHKNFQTIGGVTYNEKEMAFAKEIAKSLGKPLNMEYIEAVEPLQFTSKGRWLNRCRRRELHCPNGRITCSYLGTRNTGPQLASRSGWGNQYWYQRDDECR